MRFFMLYSNQFATGNKPIGIASLAAILKREGHQFRLFDCTNYSINVERKFDWNLAGARNLAFKYPSNPERLPERRDIDYHGLVEELLRDIDGFKPDIIGLSALTDDYPLGLGLMREVKRTFPDIPTIAGGIHATVDPGGVIAEECFDSVCVGEGEYVVLDVADRIDSKNSLEGIANLWIKRDDGMVQSKEVRPYEQKLDLFPFPDWSIYGETAFYKPFNGVVYKYDDFEMSRGCPYKCSYCINVQLQEIYKIAGSASYHREKSIDRVIREVKHAIEVYDIEFLKFWDETFLLMSNERLEEFGERYSSEVGLPYVIETTGQSITEFSAKILQKTNCKSASLGMETGSPDMRKGLLHKPVGNEVYVKAFKIMEEHGIQKVSFNMIGLPNESEIDLFRTIGLNRLVGTFTQAVGIFYPYKGTPIRDMMVRQGWMDDDFELKDLKDYDFNTFTAGNRSVVKFKDMDSRLLNRIWLLFSTYVYWPARLFPLIDHVKNTDDQFAVTLQNNLQRVTYFRKFEEWPPPEAMGVEEEAEIRPSPDNSEAVLPGLGDAEADEFAALLIGHWSGEGRERVTDMIVAIAKGALRADVEMPGSMEALAEWLEIDLANDDALRRIRAELRSLAKSNSRIYADVTTTITA